MGITDSKPKLENIPCASPPAIMPPEVSDFSRYLALGCLCFEDFSANGADELPGCWNEISMLPVVLGTNAVPQLSGLLQNGLVRVQVSHSLLQPQWCILRVYLLYTDVGNAEMNRDRRRHLSAVEKVVSELDTSSETWAGRFIPGREQKFNQWATQNEDNSSLFYIFNKLPSPSPLVSKIQEPYAREALEDLMNPWSAPPGLRTALYPYQRRSAGAMLQRELVTRLDLDPRLEERTAPDGTTFYYGPRDFEYLKDARYYETCRGGILAETMGLGKTVICLSLIVALKGHLPSVPLEYAMLPTRPMVASLVDMAIAAINRKSIPWKVEFERVAAQGGTTSTWSDMLSEHPPTYEIPRVPIRLNRTTNLPPPRRLTLAATTIIVVPQNLCKQWQSEIAKHVEEGHLKLLVMDNRKTALPPPNELREYDIVLFTRNRFDAESQDSKASEGHIFGKVPLACNCPYIGATRTRDCRCLSEDMVYDSPLKHLHFKRLIVDEGHFFANNNIQTTLVADKLVIADHRWSISGTPARDLLGVEVNMAAVSETQAGRDDILEQHREFSNKEDRSGAIDSLGSSISNFLKVNPWTNASWKEYVFRHEDRRRLTFSGFSMCLQRTLESIVIKTRPEDVEKDIGLPRVHHRIVRLAPSFYDKLTANLFTLVLTANAVTSERKDADYLFHKNSAKARIQLVSNLRQSAFFWTGFSEADVLASIKTSTGYLEKHETGCSPEDRQLMLDTLTCTNSILESTGWKSLSKSHELGFFVENWPESSADHWAFDEARTPLMTGISQLLEAQIFVNRRLGEHDPGEGLSGAGVKALASLRRSTTKEEDGIGGNNVNDKKQIKKWEKPTIDKSGIPISSIKGEPDLRRRNSVTNIRSPSKTTAQTIRPPRAGKERPQKSISNVKSKTIGDGASRDEVEKHGINLTKEDALPPGTDSEVTGSYARAKIVGTTSAKMSYLLSQILKHYKEEKILVFYQGDNTAWYIAQALELLGVEHEIYARSLQSRLKSQYVVNFDQGVETRVLLMDVGQAAFGLNLSSASRIYFVNPVCRPSIEAQAIKRAHRIGQTREVFVETLVLTNSIEEKMLARSIGMTTEEHREAKALEDDGHIRHIIQSARILPITDAEAVAGRGQMAALERAEQLWGRPDSHAMHRKRKRTLADSKRSPRVVVKRRPGLSLQSDRLGHEENDDGSEMSFVTPQDLTPTRMSGVGRETSTSLNIMHLGTEVTSPCTIPFRSESSSHLLEG